MTARQPRNHIILTGGVQVATVLDMMRRQQGLTVRALAERARIPANTAFDAITAAHAAPLDTIIKIASALGASITLRPPKGTP